MSKLDLDATVRALESGEVPAWINEHLEQYRASGGREGHHWDAAAVGASGILPCLLLTTVGRKSGVTRTMPLIYGEADGAYIIIGSKGGAETHTGWYWNLRAAPNVEIQVGPEHIPVRARVAEGAERERLWALMLGVYPTYRDYQAKTARQIPVVVLERR